MDSRGSKSSDEEETTYISKLNELVTENPNKASFIFWDRHRKRTVLTRQEVWDRSRKFAARLNHLGITKGDIVCNTLTNSAERIITSIGTLVCGAASMHGQVFLADGEDLLMQLKESQCKAIVLDPSVKNGAASILNKILLPNNEPGKLVYEDLPHLKHIVPICLSQEEGWMSELEKEVEFFVDETVTPDDVAFIFNTSGSTGFAKQVVHTHETILHISRLGNESFGTRRDSVLMNNRSMGWVGGAPIMFLGGLTRVFFDLASGKPEEDFGKFIIDMINYEKCDTALLLSADIRMVLNALESGAILDTKLRVMSTGGGPVSSVTMRATSVIAETRVVLYGSTELGLVSYLEVVDGDRYEDCCVGTPRHPVEAKILDDNQEKVLAGETGELYIRSPTVAKSYLNKPAKSRESFLDDCWFRTGDMASFDDKGQLFVFCRKSNAINNNGFIHYPGWMEKRLNNHPDIQMSVVVGIPDPVAHEELCLCVVPAPEASFEAEDLRDICRDLFVSEDKAMTPVPKYCLVFETLPTNENSKVDRKAIRTEALARLGLDAKEQI